MERCFWHTSACLTQKSVFIFLVVKACGNDLATCSTPAHYTAHHLHITWTGSAHWSCSRRFEPVQRGSFTETIKKLSCKDYFKGADCTTVELQQVSICQAVSAAFWFFLMLPQGRFLISTCVCFSHLFTASARALFQKQPCSRCSTAHQAASVWSESTLLNTINPVWCFQNLYNKKKRDL